MVSAPTDVSPIGGRGEVSLAWTLTDDATGGSVVVERRQPGGTFTDIATLDADAENYLDTGVLEGEPYEYQIRRETDSGSATSSTASVTSEITPAVGVELEGVSGGQISVSWRPRAASNVSHRVLVSGDGGATWTQATGDLPADADSATTDTVRHGERYLVAVAAATAHTSVHDQDAGRTRHVDEYGGMRYGRGRVPAPTPTSGEYGGSQAGQTVYGGR